MPVKYCVTESFALVRCYAAVNGSYRHFGIPKGR